MNKLENYITGKWIRGDGEGQLLYDAVTGKAIAAATTKGLDFLIYSLVVLVELVVIVEMVVLVIVVMQYR